MPYRSTDVSALTYMYLRFGNMKERDDLRRVSVANIYVYFQRQEPFSSVRTALGKTRQTETVFYYKRSGNLFSKLDCTSKTFAEIYIRY